MNETTMNSSWVSRSARPTTDHNTDALAATVDFWLAVVVISTLAALGILGNVLAIAVWHLQTSFNATVFLFQYLAVWDTAYLLLVMIYNYMKRSSALHKSPMSSVLYHTGNLVQLLSVNVTLLIAISRWIAVVFPLRASRLLTSKRIYVSCVVILLYCGALEAAQGIFDVFYPHDMRVFVAKRVVGLALPLLLLLIFNLSLLWTSKRASRLRRKKLLETEMCDRVAQRRDTPSDTRTCARQSTESATAPCARQSTESATASCARQSTESATAPSLDLTSEKETQMAQTIDGEAHQSRLQHQERRQQRQVQDKTERRSDVNSRVHHSQPKKGQQPQRHHMVTAVLLVSLCCFIAYPVGNSLQVYALSNPHHSLLTRFVVIDVAFIFQVLNSGLNVLIYWFFVSSFRQLAAKLWSRLCDRLHCGHKTPKQ